MSTDVRTDAPAVGVAPPPPRPGKRLGAGDLLALDAGVMLAVLLGLWTVLPLLPATRDVFLTQPNRAHLPTPVPHADTNERSYVGISFSEVKSAPGDGFHGWSDIWVRGGVVRTAMSQCAGGFNVWTKGGPCVRCTQPVLVSSHTSSKGAEPSVLLPPNSQTR